MVAIGPLRRPERLSPRHDPLNNNTPQLENTLSWVTLPGGAKSPYFYRLLPGSVAIGAGTATVLHDIATAERAAGNCLSETR